MEAYAKLINALAAVIKAAVDDGMEAAEIAAALTKAAELVEAEA